MNRYDRFLELYESENPFLLGNVWDVSSARIMAESGFKALGTSSAAIAHSLGYEDGEQMSFDELLFMVERITRTTDFPLSVDIEGGFDRDPQEIVKHIEALHRFGVVGINLEDSVVTDRRSLLDMKSFSEIIKEISSNLKSRKIKMFLNIRTDTYLLPAENPLKETLTRLPAYEESGADGIFIPCITDEEDIARVVRSTGLPVNVMCMPGLPSFYRLKELGVKRISMGNAIHQKLMESMKGLCQTIQQEQSFQSLF